MKVPPGARPDLRITLRQLCAPIQGEEGESTSAVKSGDAATDECVGLFTPDKDGHTHTSCSRVAEGWPVYRLPVDWGRLG